MQDDLSIEDGQSNDCPMMGDAALCAVIAQMLQAASWSIKSMNIDFDQS